MGAAVSDRDWRAQWRRQPHILQLDDVDVGRQVRRHFEADFLFAHGGLGPGLHDDVLQRQRSRCLFVVGLVVSISSTPPEGLP